MIIVVGVCVWSIFGLFVVFDPILGVSCANTELTIKNSKHIIAIVFFVIHCNKNRNVQYQTIFKILLTSMERQI